MATRSQQTGRKEGTAAAHIFAANERMNQLLLEHLDPAAWRAKPAGQVRRIAAIFSHVHNVRTKWLRLNAPHLRTPALLQHAHCTVEQARAALAESAAGCEQMLAEALGGNGTITAFRRDGWAKPWPLGPEMLCYMLMHEAHHRGQVMMLAHQLGCSLPAAVGARLWNWDGLWRASATHGGPGSPHK